MVGQGRSRWLASPTLSLILRCPRQRASKDRPVAARSLEDPSRPPLRSGTSG
ncbi:hypothetical protein F8B43_1467 [Methylorubrum populi]|uniref:Uncharacterized protein n=1 Tax=Methylorubrum populi TaxID=223967 RepID=A0A833N055_9HYPH|nr:hypothetical protein F8B43_1467 [Methylorubrum populi]